MRRDLEEGISSSMLAGAIVIDENKFLNGFIDQFDFLESSFVDQPSSMRTSKWTMNSIIKEIANRFDPKYYHFILLVKGHYFHSLDDIKHSREDRAFDSRKWMSELADWSIREHGMSFSFMGVESRDDIGTSLSTQDSVVNAWSNHGLQIQNRNIHWQTMNGGFEKFNFSSLMGNSGLLSKNLFSSFRTMDSSSKTQVDPIVRSKIFNALIIVSIFLFLLLLFLIIGRNGLMRRRKHTIFLDRHVASHLNLIESSNRDFD